MDQNNRTNMFTNVQTAKELPLSERVAEQINQLIREGSIEPGDKIPNEFELAERLNVGRGTIREAVKLLVARNILEIRRGKGTYVKEKIGLSEDPLGFAYVADKIVLANELFELRMQVEPWIAGLAAERITEEEKPQLKELCDIVEETIRRGEDHYEADSRFHHFIASCTHNSVINEINPIVTHGINLFTKLRVPELLEATIRTHREIADAILAGDKAGASAAMVRHLKNNKSTIEYAGEQARK
ncbi:MAG: FadR/GntR family transcriptional regulator [Eubacteriales bacterium]|nr:FadR/GntR family transcriptional regulator [Eubacteriales bacterium]